MRRAKAARASSAAKRTGGHTGEPKAKGHEQAKTSKEASASGSAPRRSPREKKGRAAAKEQEKSESVNQKTPHPHRHGERITMEETENDRQAASLQKNLLKLNFTFKSF